VYNAVQRLAREKQYDFVFDKSGELLMLYSNTKFDKSDEVLEMMGIAGKK
jgi:Skp family chaperone for outer membrane proteins